MSVLTYTERLSSGDLPWYIFICAWVIVAFTIIIIIPYMRTLTKTVSYENPCQFVSSQGSGAQKQTLIFEARTA